MASPPVIAFGAPPSSLRATRKPVATSNYVGAGSLATESASSGSSAAPGLWAASPHAAAAAGNPSVPALAAQGLGHWQSPHQAIGQGGLYIPDSPPKGPQSVHQQHSVAPIVIRYDTGGGSSRLSSVAKSAFALARQSVSMPRPEMVASATKVHPAPDTGEEKNSPHARAKKGAGDNNATAAADDDNIDGVADDDNVNQESETIFFAAPTFTLAPPRRTKVAMAEAMFLADLITADELRAVRVASAHAAQETEGRQEYLDAIDEIIESGGEEFLHAALKQAHARYGDMAKSGS